MNAAIEKASKIPREEALKRVIKKVNDRVIFALTYHPGLPSISHILLKHWKSLVRNPDMQKVFPSPPMVAYRQPPNLKKTLVRTTLPSTKNRDQPNMIGTKKMETKTM